MPKETFYFSHDYHARSDKKMVRLLAKNGVSGVGIYWCLIEMLYEEGGYMDLDECDCIASELRTKEDKVKSVINDFKLFETDGTRFWSDSVLVRLQQRGNKSKKAQESASKKWASNYKENALKRSERLTIARTKGTHTKEDWYGMLTFFDYKCVRCGSSEKVVKDHIVPIYQGGSDGIDNIQPLCQKCNCSKGSENTDHRIQFCTANNVVMPAKFIEMPANACEMPTIKESKVKEKKGKENIKGLTPFDLVFANYLEMRIKIKKPATEEAIRLVKLKLDRLSEGVIEDKIKILEQSIANSWQDVYPIKKEEKVLTKRQFVA